MTTANSDLGALIFGVIGGGLSIYYGLLMLSEFLDERPSKR